MSSKVAVREISLCIYTKALSECWKIKLNIKDSFPEEFVLAVWWSGGLMVWCGEQCA